MKRLPIVVALLAGAVLVGSAQGPAVARAAGAPTITSLSANTLPRSGRLLINGSSFGASQGSSVLSIGGLTALVTRWSDTLVVGYVPEAAPIGVDGVQVAVGSATSTTLPLTVTTRQVDGRVKWRFQVDAPYGYLGQRPAVGPDGTIVAHDPGGNVYALTPDGGLKWIFKTPAFAYGPPSIGADGTVYVASIATIYALAADGQLKWTFTDTSDGQGIIVGPTVGPDGNIYAVTDIGGIGAFALSPAGALLWSNPGNPPFSQMGQTGAEVAFGPSHAGGAIDQLYAHDNDGLPFGGGLHALTLGGGQRWAVVAGGNNGAQSQPAVGPDGTVYTTASGIYLDPCNGSCLYAFDPASGAAKWYYSPWPSGEMSEPSIGADGTIYLARSLSYLDAVTPNGTTRWSVFDGGILAHPTVDPQNTQLVAGDAPDYGQPGSVRDFSAADGRVRWDISLPSENGGYQVLMSRPRFAADGQTVYFGTAITAPFLATKSPDQYAYLYAVDASTSSPPQPGVILSSLTLSPTQVKGGSSSTGTVTLTGPAPTGGVTITLSSSTASVATAPPSVTVGGGSKTGGFRVTTARVSERTTVTIAASYAGATKSAQLTVRR
jgi:hypothetical protein